MSTKPQQPLPQQVNVDISQADDVKCDKCGHDVFIPVFMIKKVSAIMSPNGQEYTIGLLRPKEVYHVYEEFIPQGKVYLKWVKGKANKKYNDKLVDYVRQYYEVSSVEAKDYIDILSRDEKGIESLVNIVKKKFYFTIIMILIGHNI